MYSACGHLHEQRAEDGRAPGGEVEYTDREGHLQRTRERGERGGARGRLVESAERAEYACADNERHEHNVRAGERVCGGAMFHTGIFEAEASDRGRSPPRPPLHFRAVPPHVAHLPAFAEALHELLEAEARVRAYGDDRGDIEQRRARLADAYHEDGDRHRNKRK